MFLHRCVIFIGLLLISTTLAYAGEGPEKKHHFAAEMREQARELAFTAPSGLNKDFDQAIAAAKTGASEADIIQHASAFLRLAKKPEALKKYEDSFRLLLGRAHHGTGQYEEAVQSFRRVSPTSPEYAQAQADMTWSYLLKRTPDEALRVARTFVTGSLKSRFSPDAYVAVAFALKDSCHFPEAMESILFFRKSYERPYHWLGLWKKNGPPEGKSLVDLVVSKSVPDQLYSEWSRSPILIQGQEQLKNAKDSAARDAIRTAMNSDLEARASLTELVLVDALKSLRSVETEIYESQGRVPAEKSDGEPLFLKSDLRSRCPKKLK